jgi:hypothetical protein
MPAPIQWTEELLNALPSSVGEALATGSRYYFNGTKCPGGHLCARRAADGKCHYCVRERAAVRTAALREKIRLGEHTVTRRDQNKFHGKSVSLEAWIYRSAKARANKRGIEFSITIEDIIIPERCPVFGIKIDKTWGGVEENNQARFSKPSLDRIDSSKGYIKGNVVILSYRANIVKQNGSAIQHRMIAEYIRAEYRARGWCSD